MIYGRRFERGSFKKAVYWADEIADEILVRHPDTTRFVCAAGISPSGPIHFGNFREIATTSAVVHALRDKGKDAELLFSWDNLDRFRKVPAGIPDEYKEHIGKPLADVPSVGGKYGSYAEENQQGFLEAMEQMNIPISYRNQADLYRAGTYDTYIQTILQKRKEIADILLSHMTDKAKTEKGIHDTEYRDTYFPLEVYSRFTGKDATKILSYDGDKTLRYFCKITKKEDEIDITKHRIVKPFWKIDWAMRWMHEGVVFEPAGSDHAAPGGSYDASSEIAEKIFNTSPPLLVEYGFVGLRGVGTKMSGSSGQTITPSALLAIYEPQFLLWMYLRRLPEQTFSLTLDTEVYRQYDEFDAFVKKAIEGGDDNSIAYRVFNFLSSLYGECMVTNPIPFRYLVGVAQAVDWDVEKVSQLLQASGQSYDMMSVHSRVRKAKEWVNTYGTGARVTVRVEPNVTSWEGVDKENKGYVQKIYNYVLENDAFRIEDIEEFLYDLPKELHQGDDLKKAQRLLFKHVYQLLITKDAGPRLSTFLWALPKEKLLHLLKLDG